MGQSDQTYTDFGFEQVPVGEKSDRVRAVFDRVAGQYDAMNDCLSLGLHRLWKKSAIHMGSVSAGDCVLDLAAGSGDLTQQWARAVGESGHVYMTDINADMLRVGTDRLLDTGVWSNVSAMQVDAEALPFEPNAFDCISISFGLRNMTRHASVLSEAYRVLKPGGRLVILEFSHPQDPLIQKLYDTYSFEIVPRLGAWLVEDEASYRYLVESIRKHPHREVLREKILHAGFDSCEVLALSFGIVALHCGVKF